MLVHIEGRLDISNEIHRTLALLEETLWRAETRGNRALMDVTFANDFFEFGRSGRIWRRHEMLDFFGPIDTILPLPDLKITLLAPTTALVTYNSIWRRDGQIEHARRSSVWSLQQDRWRLRFHQGTPYVPEPEISG